MADPQASPLKRTAPDHTAKARLPRKRFYRARAHSNPLSDSQFPVPISPSHIDWSHHFPAFFRPASQPKCLSSTCIESQQQAHEASAAAYPTEDADREAHASGEGGGEESKESGNGDACGRRPVEELSEMKVRFADIGCGFGGLLVKLSPMFPETLMIGMELRDKVSEYVKERILALRKENPGKYENISIVRTNAMKYLPNYFEKGQLQKMFFLFPDPHFKEKNHRRRVISVSLLAEYAYALAVGGILYTITDVQELGEWMKSCLDSHPLFEEVSAQEQESDPVVRLLKTATEEGQKVERNRGETFQSAYRRVAPRDAGA